MRFLQFYESYQITAHLLDPHKFSPFIWLCLFVSIFRLFFIQFGTNLAQRSLKVHSPLQLYKPGACTGYVSKETPVLFSHA